MKIIKRKTPRWIAVVLSFAIILPLIGAGLIYAVNLSEFDGGRFFEDFSDYTSAGNWRQTKSGTGNTYTNVSLVTGDAYTGGKALRFTGMSQNYPVYTTDWPSAQNFTYTARIRSTSSSSNNVTLGMVYRAQDKSSSIAPTGSLWGSVMYHGRQQTPTNGLFLEHETSYPSLPNTWTYKNLELGEWYIVSMSLNGTALSIYLDGVLVGTEAYTSTGTNTFFNGINHEGFFGFRSWGTTQTYEIDWVSIGQYSTDTTSQATITAQPVAAEVIPNTPIPMFSVAATPSAGGVLSYRWQRSTNGGVTWADIAGATGSTVTPVSTTIDDDGDMYRCAVINTASNARTKVTYSAAAALSVKPLGDPPVITKNAEDVTATLGSTATFSVEVTAVDGATGDPAAISYQWQQSTNNGSAWTNIPGATNAAYTTSATTNYANNGNKYRCQIMANGHTVFSRAALLMVQSSWGTNQPYETQFANSEQVGNWRTYNNSASVLTGQSIVTDPSAMNNTALRLTTTNANSPTTGGNRVFHNPVDLPTNIADFEYAMRVKVLSNAATGGARIGWSFRILGGNTTTANASNTATWIYNDGGTWGSERFGGSYGSLGTTREFTLRAWHTVRIIVYGTRITIWFDGVKLVDNVTSSQLQTGVLGGIGLASWYAVQEVYIDNMYVGPIRSDDEVANLPYFKVEKPVETFDYEADYTGGGYYINATTLANHATSYNAQQEALAIPFTGTGTTNVIDSASSHTQDFSLTTKIKSVPAAPVKYTYTVEGVNGEEEREIDTTGDFGVAFRWQSATTFAYLRYFAQTRTWSLYDASNTLLGTIGQGPIMEADTWYGIRIRAIGRILRLWVTDADGNEQLVGMITANNLTYPLMAGQVGFMSAGQAKTLYVAELEEIIYHGVQRPDPGPLQEITISSADMTVRMDNRFPMPRSYTLTATNRTLTGYPELGYMLGINGEEWLALLQGDPVVTADSVVYNVRAYEDLEGEDYIDFKFTYKVEGTTLPCEIVVVKENGAAKLFTFDMSNMYLAKFVGTVGTNASNDIIRSAGYANPGTWNNMGDQFSNLGSASPGTVRLSAGFIYNGNIAAGLWNDSTETPTRNIVSVVADDTSVTPNIPKEMTLNNGSWVYRISSSYPDFEARYPPPGSMNFTVLVAADINNSGSADWQDAANLYREAAIIPLGGDEIRDYFSYVSFNFVSMANNPFLRGLDDLKKLYNYTDGFGQMILEKGYQAEGHDDSHPDMGGHIGIRQGGSKDFNTLIDEGKKYNAKIGVHVNYGEYILDSFFGPPLDFYTRNASNYPSSNGWGWLDQAFYFDKQKDFQSGELEKRMQMLHEDAPGLSWIYVDIYSGADYTARMISNTMAKKFGWINATEFSGPMEQNVIWTHWGTDLYYPTSGDGSRVFRFLYNNSKDAFPAASKYVSQLLRGSVQPGIASWQNRTSINEGMTVFYNQNLPSKYMQYFPVSYWNDSNTEIVFGAPKDADGNVVPSMAGARSVAQSSGETWIYAPDGTLVAIFGAQSSSTYTRKEAGEMFIPWNPITEDKIYYWQGKTSGGRTSWTFPSSWGAEPSVAVYELRDNGKVLVSPSSYSVTGNVFTPSGLSRQIPYVIYKSGATPLAPAADFGAVEAGRGYLADPGFDTGSFGKWQASGDTSSAIMARDNRRNSIMQVNSGSAVTVTNEIVGLTVGKTYTASIWYQVGGNGTGGAPGSSDRRNVTLSVLSGADVLASRVFNRTQYANVDYTGKWTRNSSTTGDAANSPLPNMARIHVKFKADAGTATFKLDVAAGTIVVYFDDARIWENPGETVAPAGAWFYEDFENVSEYWGPFVYGRSGDNCQAHISEKAPATVSIGSKDYPTNQLESYVLDGRYSLKLRSEAAGVIARTTVNSIAFEPGKTYTVQFMYNTSVNNVYYLEARTGTGTVIGSRQTLPATNTSSDTQRNPQRAQLRSYTFTVPATEENAYLAFACTGSVGTVHTTGMLLDNFVIYNMTDLIAALNEAISNYEALDGSVYTADTWSAATAAYNAAVAVRNNTSATPGQIAGATEALNAAISDLVIASYLRLAPGQLAAVSVRRGASIQINVECNFPKDTLTYTSAVPVFATVDATGKVTGVIAGITVIRIVDSVTGLSVNVAVNVIN